MRTTKFQTDSYYHTYNRGVDKREVFCDEKDYLRFLRSMKEFNQIEPVGSLYQKDYINKINKGVQHPIGCWTPKARLVDFICYCLIPNHFHFLIKQLVDNGISEFMKRLGGYTTYFNKKYKRTGSLFGSKFQFKPITSDEQLIYISAYINGNPEIHKMCKAKDWPWSSYQEYLGASNSNICNKEVILSQFQNIDDYKNYITRVINNAIEVKQAIKDCLIE